MARVPQLPRRRRSPSTSFPAVAQTGPLKIGIYISEQDDQGADEMVTPYMDQLRLGVELARSEINAGGGVLGRRIEFVYRNDLGSPPSVASVASLVTNEGCEAIVSGFVQASPRLISVRSPSPVPVLAGFWTEGTYCGPVAKFFAPTPMQIVPSIRAWLPDEFVGAAIHHYQLDAVGPGSSMYLFGAAGGRSSPGMPWSRLRFKRAHAVDDRSACRRGDSMGP